MSDCRTPSLKTFFSFIQECISGKCVCKWCAVPGKFVLRTLQCREPAGFELLAALARSPVSMQRGSLYRFGMATNVTPEREKLRTNHKNKIVLSDHLIDNFSLA